MRSKPKRWFHSACSEILVCVFSFLPVGTCTIYRIVLSVLDFIRCRICSLSHCIIRVLLFYVSHILRVSQSCNRRGVIWSYDVRASDNVTSYTFQRLVRNDAFGIIKTNAHSYNNKNKYMKQENLKMCSDWKKNTSKDFETIFLIKNSLWTEQSN